MFWFSSPSITVTNVLVQNINFPKALPNIAVFSEVITYTKQSTIRFTNIDINNVKIF